MMSQASLVEEKRGAKVAGKEKSEQMACMRRRLPEVLTNLRVLLRNKKPADAVVDIVAHVEREKLFPEAHYAFEAGLLTPRLTRFIEDTGKHWVSELNGSCHIQWEGPWRPLERVAEDLRRESSLSFRSFPVRSLNEETKTFHAFTRSVRLDHYGRKRIVIVHEQANLKDAPYFLFTDALYWEGSRILETWLYRWQEKLFQEFFSS